MALVSAAVEAGVRYLDTAAVYGTSEASLGTLAPLLHRHGVRTCTKTAACDGPETFAGEVARSLARLNTSSVDTLMLHSATTPDLQARWLGGAFGALKDQGRIVRSGASTYGPETARAALDLDWCDAVQVEYSILNQGVLCHIAGAVRPGQEIIARSVLCKGLLTRRRHTATDSVAKPIAPALDELEHLAEEWHYELPELAIRFALDSPGIDIVLVGVSSAAELDLAMRALSRPPLQARQMQRLADFDRSDLDCVHPERWPQPAGVARMSTATV